jgi:hypothetical protein
VLLALQKAYYRLRCKRNAFFYRLAHVLFENGVPPVSVRDFF